jgi:arylsulfatase A-like enzyme
VLPPEIQTVGDRVGLTYKDSKPSRIVFIRPPKNAPNIVIVLLDDVGFGAAGTFGGLIKTPALDKLAAEGLRYNRFHTTALCSPSRAALLTGRNHHDVGTGNIIELATSYEGYDSIIPESAATIAEVLKGDG